MELKRNDNSTHKLQWKFSSKTLNWIHRKFQSLVSTTSHADINLHPTNTSNSFGTFAVNGHANISNGNDLSIYLFPSHLILLSASFLVQIK